MTDAKTVMSQARALGAIPNFDKCLFTFSQDLFHKPIYSPLSFSTKVTNMASSEDLSSFNDLSAAPQQSQTFSLASLSLKLDDAASLEPHIAPLKSSSANKITHINLSGNTIGVPAAEALAPLLSSLTSLESANLADIFTSRLLSEIPQALESLLSALLECKKLHTINLSDNAFGLNTQAPLVKYLAKATSLRHLILNNNGLGPEAGKLVSGALTTLAQAKRDAGKGEEMLETIVCGRNRLENGSAASWAEALSAHSSCLKEVRLSQNGIRVEGMTAILRLGLKDAKRLQTVDIQDNLLTVPGAQALCEVLPGWMELRELQISDMLIRARGGVLLGETLADGKNKKLEVLRCQYNEVDSKGIKALVDAVGINSLPKLRRVELNGNKFSEDDPAIETLGEILSERKDEAGVEGDSDGWGIDELDELESEDEDEDADADADEEDDEEAVVLKHADEAEKENVAQEKDNDVDALADKLGKTAI